MKFTFDPTSESLFSTVEEEEQFIKESSLLSLMKNYRPSDFSERRKSNWVDSENEGGAIKEVRPHDILIGRFVSHPGNVLARKVIVSNRAYFQAIDETEHRKMATDALVGFFESKGCRFLEANEKKKGTFKYAHYDAVTEKFRKSLRETGFRNNPHRKKHIATKVTRKPEKVRVSNEKRTTEKVIPKKVKRNIKSTSERREAPLWANVSVGSYLGIFWPMDDVYYPGQVISMKGSEIEIHYDDGENEVVDLSRNKFVKLGRPGSRTPGKLEVQRSGEQSIDKTTYIAPKSSPESSVRTAESSESESLTDENMEKIAVSVIAGSFSKVVPAPVPTLASYLTRKLQKKRSRSPVTTEQ